MEDEYCEGCGVNITNDEDAEYGYCFSCQMSACVPGNISGGQY